MSLRFGIRMEEHDALQMNALQLAYAGDTVWEMIVRIELISRGYTVRHMHQHCVSMVNARSQARILEALSEKLTETEKEIARRGRNAHAKHPSPKHQHPDDYAASTGFEALLGFLYLTGQDARISELVDEIRKVDLYV